MIGQKLRSLLGKGSQTRVGSPAWAWRPRPLWAGALLAAGSLAALWPVARCSFLNYDDPTYVTDNPAVRHGLTWRGLVWAFTTTHGSNWHPVTWLSHMADCQLFGLHPAGHHLTNLALHLANTLLLFGLLRGLTRALWPSALVAALFAWHPLHVESVAWMAERKDVLSTFFFLLTIWSYTKYVEKAERRMQNPESGTTHHVSRFTFRASHFYTLALILFVLGLMSKPMLVTLPFVLLLLDYWPLRRLAFPPTLQHSNTPTLRLVLEKLPFFALAGVSCAVHSIGKSDKPHVDRVTYCGCFTYGFKFEKTCPLPSPDFHRCTASIMGCE